MVTSSYVCNILSLLCDGDELGLRMRAQLPYLVEREYHYTGSGVFVYFDHMEETPRFKDVDNSMMNGVEIRSSIGNVEAEAQFYIEDGLIKYLEIWCYGGDYPHQDLTSYVLVQNWAGSPGKRIEHNLPKQKIWHRLLERLRRLINGL